jgi:hypothetical protein
MSWRIPEEQGGGRKAIWLDASIPVRFTFDSEVQPAISKEWLARLADTANSTTGLIVVDEPHAAPVLVP